MSDWNSWNAILPKRRRKPKQNRGPSCIDERCNSKNTVTEIEAESQGRGSPPLYRCLDCGAQWGRD